MTLTTKVDGYTTNEDIGYILDGISISEDADYLILRNYKII